MEFNNDKKLERTSVLSGVLGALGIARFLCLFATVTFYSFA